MANTFTTNYGLTKPEVGGDNDQWGTHINSNLTDIDTQVFNKVDKVDQKGVTHTLSFSGNNITTGTTNGFNSYVAGDRLYIANSSSNTANYGEFLIDNVVSDTVLDLKKADGSTDAGFTTESSLSSTVYLVSIPKFTRQGLTQLAGEIKLYASVSTSVIQNLGSISYAGATRYFWLPCDGTAVSRTVYDDLFDVIGTSFGAGNGSSTFNVPDFRGRAPIGTGTGVGNNSSDTDGSSAPTGGTALTARELGEWGGQETYQIHSSQLPTHVHAQTAHTHGFGGTQVVGDHTHTINGRTDNQGANASGKKALIEYGNADLTATASGAGGHTINFSNATVASTSSADTGNGGFANSAVTLSLTQPYLVIGSYIIAT